MEKALSADSLISVSFSEIKFFITWKIASFSNSFVHHLLVSLLRCRYNRVYKYPQHLSCILSFQMFYSSQQFVRTYIRCTRSLMRAVRAIQHTAEKIMSETVQSQGKCCSVSSIVQHYRLRYVHSLKLKTETTDQTLIPLLNHPLARYYVHVTTVIAKPIIIRLN